MNEQLTLFDNDDKRSGGITLCPYCRIRPAGILPGTDGREDECIECNHDYNERRLLHYAIYGRPGGGKHPGMLFPGQKQGDGEPTFEQRLAAIQTMTGMSPQRRAYAIAILRERYGGKP